MTGFRRLREQVAVLEGSVAVTCINKPGTDGTEVTAGFRRLSPRGSADLMHPSMLPPQLLHRDPQESRRLRTCLLEWLRQHIGSPLRAR